MKPLNCLIIEDEPLAAEGLASYVKDVPFLNLIASCHDAIAALEILDKKTVDVIFLDIHLPKLKGLDFLKTLKNPPQVILTTAYHQYALEGYEHNVVDYLLKPFGFPRFLNAVNKLNREQPIVKSTSVAQPENRPYHFFNENKRMVKVYLDEILFIESLKEYVKIHLSNNKSLITKFQIGELESFLNDSNFMRTHRSYLIAVDKIDAYSATTIEIKGNKIPIGRGYKIQVEKQLQAK